jgi:hypothetical protein
LYWTNTANGTLNKVFITAAGTPLGSSSIVAANVPKADDFIFKADGTAFIAQNQEDELSAMLPGSKTAEVVAGSPISTTLAGVTAGKFGRLASDCNRLYLTTSGGERRFLLFEVPYADFDPGLALPINGTVVVAGKVAYIDTTGF